MKKFLLLFALIFIFNTSCPSDVIDVAAGLAEGACPTFLGVGECVRDVLGCSCASYSYVVSYFGGQLLALIIACKYLSLSPKGALAAIYLTLYGLDKLVEAK